MSIAKEPTFTLRRRWRGLHGSGRQRIIIQVARLRRLEGGQLIGRNIRSGARPVAAQRAERPLLPRFETPQSTRDAF